MHSLFLLRLCVPGLRGCDAVQGVRGCEWRCTMGRGLKLRHAEPPPAGVRARRSVPRPASPAPTTGPSGSGPQRDGVWRETGPPPGVPEGGARRSAGAPRSAAGYAGPGGRGRPGLRHRPRPAPDAPKPADAVPARSRVPGIERVLCLNEADGEALWTHEYDCPYTVSYASGPRTTPTVDGDRVYTLGAEGTCSASTSTDGKSSGRRSSPATNAPTPMWGFAGHPLVDGDRLICLTAGKDAVATAFDKKTGDVLWSALSAKEPGYCPADDLRRRRRAAAHHLAHRRRQRPRPRDRQGPLDRPLRPRRRTASPS